MGGFGSGRTAWGGRPRAEHCLRFDVREVHRAGFLGSQTRMGTWQWTFRLSGKHTIGFIADSTSLTLDYKVNGEPRRYAVAIEWTPARFGGRVPWFLCPGRGCGRRCAVLYSARGNFACRRCHRLVYGSQVETRLDRLQRKAIKAWERIGGDFPTAIDCAKPKGMHWRTWKRLHERAEVIGNIWNGAFCARAATFLPAEPVVTRTGRGKS